MPFTHGKMKNKQPTIHQKEWKLVFLIAILILLVSQLPLIYGHLTEGENEVFMGIPDHVTDANNHLNWVLQAKEGKLLFANEFTPEILPALIFNPFHLLVGNTARLLHAPIIPIYNIFGMLIILGFCLTLYLFISYFISDKQTRLLTYIITLTGAGFGLWWKLSKLLFDKWVVSADLWVTEINTFQSFGHPHFTLAASLLLLIFYFALRSFNENKITYSIYAGLLSLLLATIHIFDTITMTVVLVGWFTYRQITHKKWSWQDFKKLSIIGSITVPAILYYAWVFFMNPSYKEWNTLNQTVTPGPLAIISGFGLIFFLTIIWIIAHKKEFFKKETPTLFLALWSVLNIILIYLPINVQRRFLLGLHIPLSILGTLAFVQLAVPYLQKKAALQKISYYFLYVLFSLITTTYLLTTTMQGMHTQATSIYGNDPYLSIQEYQALQWIDKNIPNEEVIIAPYHLSNYIPAITGNKVYCGHWAQTINFEEKCQEVKDFYEGKYTFSEKYWYVDVETFEVQEIVN